MTTEIRVPVLGESVVEATVGQWFKQAGEAITVDEPLVELETDKVTIEVPAPVSGVLTNIIVKPGDTVAVGALLGAIAKGGGKAAPTPSPSASVSPAPPPKVEAETKDGAKQLEREPHIREEVTDGDMPPSPAARVREMESEDVGFRR